MRVIVPAPAEDDLPCDCTMPDALPWVALAAAWAGGLALTAGWLVRAAWHAAHDPEVIRWVLR